MEEHIKAGLVISRVFNAPRELVWKAWTNSDWFVRWWGPTGFTVPVVKIDLRVGGIFLNCMRSPEGKEIWNTGSYRDVIAPGWLVFTDSFADAEGRIVPASYYGIEGEWPLETLVTVMLQEHEGKTTMTVSHAGFPPDKPREDAQVGWGQSFDKLDMLLTEEQSYKK